MMNMVESRCLDVNGAILTLGNEVVLGTNKDKINGVVIALYDRNVISLDTNSEILSLDARNVRLA